MTRLVVELATLLEGDSPIADGFDLTPDYQTDVLVVGGGGAGCAAALHAHGAGAKVILATKLRLGDSNSVMAQGGMQISVDPEDSPITHFVDTLKGGLIKALEGIEVNDLLGRMRVDPATHQTLRPYFFLRCKAKGQMKESLDFADVIATGDTPLPKEYAACKDIGSF